MTRDDWLNRRDHGDGVVELQLGHAPENRLTLAFLDDLTTTFKDLSTEQSVRAIFLTSPFKDFSTGVDPEIEIDAAMSSALNRTFLSLFSCLKPVVSAAVGLSSGAGMFFALASDLRVAHARAGFEMTEVLLSRTYPVALMEIARSGLDRNTQRRLMLTGQRLGPIAARNAQIIEVIADDLEDLHGYALKETRKLAALDPQTFARIKGELRADTFARIEALMDAEMMPVGAEDRRAG